MQELTQVPPGEARAPAHFEAGPKGHAQSMDTAQDEGAPFAAGTGYAFEDGYRASPGPAFVPS